MPKDSRIHSKRAVCVLVFNALGLNKDWTSLEKIDAKCAFVLENKSLLQRTLTKRVLGNLTLLKSDVDVIRRKSLLAFCRRLCASLNGALLRKRHQKRVGKKTVSTYHYKIITA